MKYLISYDISSNKKRYRVVKALEEFGCYRIQKSVYFIDSDEKTIKDLRKSIMGYFRGDSLIIIPLELSVIKNSEFLGKGYSEMPKGEDIFL
ncbi:CRISPR-associated endonuclease Cas2 [uncultured Ilyobacter sp.]|uniref:CRISPR-associated endonuclease Cas2 n=1 Tax=uncultured Ilyobacter sp. TaxID=544433 RepID=UPI0029C93ED9|nr:CRISPR-associated endonuclease Cas2 [uncultured Ilyobacter sp.]